MRTRGGGTPFGTGSEGGVSFLNLSKLYEENRVKDVGGGGDCLFRCIAESFYGNRKKHGDVRREIVDILMENRNDFEDGENDDVYHPDWVKTLTAGAGTSYDHYLRHVIEPGKWGDTGCLLAFQRKHPEYKFMVWVRNTEMTIADEGGMRVSSR